MTFRAAATPSTDGSTAASGVVTIPAGTQAGDTVTIVVTRTGASANVITATTSNGSVLTLEREGPLGGAGRYAVFTLTAIEGTAGSVVTAEAGGATGRWVLLADVRYDVGPLVNAMAVSEASTSSATWVLPAVTPLAASAGEVVYTGSGTTGSGGQQTFTPAVGTLRSEGTHTNSSGTNGSAFIVDRVFSSDSEIAASSVTGALNSNGRGIVALVYAGEASPPPGVDLGADRAVPAGSAVSVSAFATAPGGTIEEYEWTQDGTAVTLDATDADEVNFTAPSSGQVTLTCLVTDSNGQTASDSITITFLQVLDFASVTSTGWTNTGGAASPLAALSDEDDGTYLLSGTDPTGLTLTCVLAPQEPPVGDYQPLFQMQVDEGTGTTSARLLDTDGTTEIATAGPAAIPTSAGSPTLVFDAGDLTGIAAATWRAGGLVVELSVTATA